MNTIAIDERTTPPRQVAAPPGDDFAIRHGMEHRWGLRVACCAGVRLSGGTGITGTGRMRDISMSGAYIETSVALPPHAPIEIAVQRADGSTGRKLSGCVVRKDAAGIGIEWTDTPAGSICPLLECTEPCAQHRHIRT